MEKRIDELEHDQQEQCLRRSCILFHGIPESPNKNTNKIVILLTA